MPITKTAKRALRSSKRKEEFNKNLSRRLEIAKKKARKTKSKKDIAVTISLTDRARKRGVIHKNKAARIKSTLSKLSSKSHS